LSQKRKPELKLTIFHLFYGYGHTLPGHMFQTSNKHTTQHIEIRIFLILPYHRHLRTCFFYPKFPQTNLTHPPTIVTGLGWKCTFGYNSANNQPSPDREGGEN